MPDTAMFFPRRGLAGHALGSIFSKAAILLKEFEMANVETGTYRLKTGLADMLKGGVIMDVTTPEQARIAQEAGACAVMALSPFAMASS